MSSAKFILRVDDVGWLPPDKTKDVGLAYFAKWREALGSRGLPVYYGVIPTMIGHDEACWLQDNMTAGEELAVHGYSHAKGEIVTEAMMRAAASLFSQSAPCQTYIPPFNEYDAGTIRDWGEAWPGGYFLGGFSPQDHNLGIAPVQVGKAIHISAYRPLYDHTEPLIDHLERYLQEARGLDVSPVVVTLHATWGYQRLDLLPRVMELVKPHLVPISDVTQRLQESNS